MCSSGMLVFRMPCRKFGHQCSRQLHFESIFTDRMSQLNSGTEGGGMREGGVEAEVGAVEEGGEFGEAESEAFGGGSAEGDVAEFASGAGGLVVGGEVGVGGGGDFGGV